ncbi:MAG: bifunctional demethylmenaquinone methyltransferase/2-methoxy-6-polyprenyl-1,4-benzoquinol methylase UbiE [Aestuariivita sp.]|nr:bifunctional demethylmenaquinone methyltransferase/2-methoxy-6-polyprenyl-1,4-benzoquinol methylase UbiE [Aestuariivita sp.]MCY4202770.1 bifunctional demethylmenaquinone methyltransferase/2-methoxy-6-polyprenyl-1,4-benzoquinol methylase UbiE [Aestuariivita sp.]MCY4289978.1 bifunctional demethylmenaquinone methyltransferase/2-methoxy-6-polyprenyl-1,4-benzoquinol methylase UbiE [Aestuariivita sp.]MCY4345681.1 bifunctional demethylmenaquinone methyltransferase/2-methoxy-6-polyprenyl-1,4-benzoqui
MGNDGKEMTHFGYQEVSEREKEQRVKGVFESVARRYDIMNDLMSVGIHRLWKNALIDWLAPRPEQNLLDVAGGTGDIAFRFLQRVGRGNATVLDLTEPMLIEGRRRAQRKQLQNQISWVVGDALALPFDRNSFDIYTISFGIRNVTRPEDALKEAYRVLINGGRLMILEFSNPNRDYINKLYDAYSYEVIPRLGQAVTQDRESYRYLVESIRQFPNQETFREMIREAGFSVAKFRNLSLGIATLYSAWKI